jgi:hypothetical protein
MKEAIKDILEKHYYGRNFIEDKCADEILDLFSVMLSETLEEAENKATERYEHIRGVDYGNGLEHGFESGAEWIVEELKRNEA